LSKGKGVYGVARRFTKSSLDSGDGRKINARHEKRTEPREQGSFERNGSEEIEEEDEGTERLGRETRSRDSFSNSAEKGTI
jgi:ribosomal protein L3